MNIFKRAEELIENSQLSMKALIDGKDSFVVFGAGQIGRKIAKILISKGMRVIFADDTIEKIGKKLDGLPIYSIEMAANKIEKKGLVIAAVYNPHVDFNQLTARLSQDSGMEAISFLRLAAIFGSEILPLYSFCNPYSLLEYESEILWLRDRLQDDFSKELLDQQIYLRLTFDHAILGNSVGMNFSEISKQFADDITYIDGGAYTGDTLDSFLKQVGSKFAKIICFEPDQKNFKALSDNLKTLELGGIEKKIELHNKGLWSRPSILKFDAAGNQGSSLQLDGGCEVEVVSLDSIELPSGQIFIKLDVEGAEHEAIFGMQELIKKSHPIMAISVYHRPPDLWELAKQITNIHDSYKLTLRNHGNTGADLMLYAS